MNQTKQLKIRPYARLLTMLGEQLIRNERIALIELIKNAYDADAEWVKVTFKNFGKDYQIRPESSIIIEDNGHGMNQQIIENHWLNPATPEKKKRKKTRDTTLKGRIIQGEKGIGRFAILKLGRQIEIVTRAQNEPHEHCISYDFSHYDDDFLTENGYEKDLFIDDLSVTLMHRAPQFIKPSALALGARKKQRSEHGTRIAIHNLKGRWTEKKVASIYRDLTKLASIFPEKQSHDFEVSLYQDEKHQNFQSDYLEKLHELLDNRSVIKIEQGHFNAEEMTYEFTINNDKRALSLFDPKITGLKVFKDRFGNAGHKLKDRKIECGSFEFGFYIFDLSAQVAEKYRLDKDDKTIIRDHRIYLYRDGIRVYPYGEPDDDWLRIDIYRGTISAGHFLSNDQVVGFVKISQKHNPNLKDKTNREGLIDEGDATEDFITLLQTFLAWIRQTAYARYRQNLSDRKDQTSFKNGQVQQNLDVLKSAVGDNKKALQLLAKTEQEYKTERRYLVQRAETTEELAGVGLSVETASHDIMAIMEKVLINLDNLIQDMMSIDEIDKEYLLKELQSIRGGLSFAKDRIKNIQTLFKSSKQRRKSVRIKDAIQKVERIYRGLLKKQAIQLTVHQTGSPLIARTTDAVLLQLLLNLFDNAVYWLQQTVKEDKQIEIILDGDKGQMIFSDNGPGIDKEDTPYIFEPFYSGKGDEGRGLGLYIARQLLERHEYSIELAELADEKPLPGASFVINLCVEEK